MVIPTPPAAAYWQLQTAPNCVEESVRIAVAVQKHELLNEARVDGFAQAQGIYDPSMGTHGATSIPFLLHHYGLHARQRSMNKKSLTTALGKRYSVIAVVDSSEIWYGVLGPADHALNVDSVHGNTVILTDTGVPWGRTETVSWARFAAAWAASADLAITAY